MTQRLLTKRNEVAVIPHWMHDPFQSSLTPLVSFKTQFLLNKELILVRIRTMAKVTSKLQITLPKALAEEFGIHPGDDIFWQSAGDAIRVIPAKSQLTLDTQTRLALFDQATQRQVERQGDTLPPPTDQPALERGWTREDLYDRDRTG